MPRPGIEKICSMITTPPSSAAELETEDGDRRDRRVLERVLHDGLPGAGADRERGPDVVRLERVDDRGADLPCDRRARDEADEIAGRVIERSHSHGFSSNGV